MTGIDRGVDLTEVLAEQNLLTPDQIEAATDPSKALGAATAFVDRALSGENR
jgi:hypothetical protein